MGLFDKKYCDICGEKIGLLGKRKLEDGNMCKDCAKKLSHWFDERRHSTIDQIKEQLAYREENKKMLEDFHPTTIIETSNKNLYVDYETGMFTIANDIDEDENPDLVRLDQIKECYVDIKEIHVEEKYKDEEDGEMKSYFPPRYKYKYDYYLRVKVDSPWFDEMFVQLNFFQIEERERGKIRKIEALGESMVNSLINGGANNRGEDAKLTEGKATWTCSCGHENDGKFCAECGKPKELVAAEKAEQTQKEFVAGIKCDKCGWTPTDLNHIPKFCPECGDPIDVNDMNKN